MTTQRRRFKNETEAAATRRLQGREKYKPFSAEHLPWRLIINGTIIACLKNKEDALFLRNSLHKHEGYIEPRTKIRPYKRRDTL